ncbi:MAG: PTS sugar transporter subunit IIA, partial [bacterium]
VDSGLEAGATMIGVIIVTHGDLGKQLLKTSEDIVGAQENVVNIPLLPEEGIDDLRTKVSQALKELDSGEGVIILTDMIGGTPTNTSLSVAHSEKVEVITGVNLPILLELFSYRQIMPLEALSDKVCQSGQRSVINAKQILLKKLADQNQPR